jgi:hypothetical protein
MTTKENLFFIRKHSLSGVSCAEDQDRTGDPTIFSRVLYQLSYLGSGVYSNRSYNECQEFGLKTD